MTIPIVTESGLFVTEGLAYVIADADVWIGSSYCNANRMIRVIARERHLIFEHRGSFSAGYLVVAQIAGCLLGSCSNYISADAIIQ